MPSLYASRVPGVLYEQQLPHEYPLQFDVVISDSLGRTVSRYPWFYKCKPDKRNKYIMHNCNKYNLIWRD